MLLGLGVMGFASCSDDTENPYATASSINIVSSSLNFDATASQGGIHYTAGGPVTVTTSNDWCKAELSGDSITVTVDQNVGKSGRAASVTLRSGADSVSLAVVQNGVVTQLEVKTVSRSNDEAASESYAFKSNLDLSVVSTPDWVSASISNDSLHVTFTENATGHLRSGYISYGSGDFLDSVKVYQADFDKDIAGNYNVTYYRNETATTTTTLRNKALSASGLKISNMLTLPMAYDAANGTFSVSTGSYVGTNVYLGTSYYVYMIFGRPEGYWFAYNTGYDMTGVLEYSEAEGTKINFDYMVSGVEINKLIFRRFYDKSLAEGNDSGTAYATWVYPTISRASTSEAKPSPYIVR